MDESEDPYEPGAGVFPPELAGREAERAQFDVRITRLGAGRRARGMALWGLRGVGKTVLMRDFQTRAEAAGWATGFHELGTGDPLRPVIARGALAALRGLQRHSQLRTGAKRALRVLRSFSVTAMPHGVSLSLQVEPEPGRADSGELEHDIQDLLGELGELTNQAGAGLVIFLDELQLASTHELGSLLRALQQLERRELPLLLVSAGLPNLPLKLVEASSGYAERMFTYHEVGELDADSARDALALPAERAGVKYTPDALDELLAHAGGFPFFLQVYGSHAWRAAPGSPIDLDAAKRAHITASRELDTGFHRLRWDRCTPLEQQFLYALAQLAPGPQPIAEVNRRLGRTAAQTTMVREALITKRGLIHSPGRGLIQFNMPLFGDYVRRRHDPAPAPAASRTRGSRARSSSRRSGPEIDP